jgi:hypothetical protein
MSNDRMLDRPYHPNKAIRQGRKTKHEYLHRIAYTEVVRGLYDEIPTLLFIGAPFELLQDVCSPICRMMQGRVKDITLEWEHSCRCKNGKHYWRIAVGIVGLDEHFISMGEFIKLIVSKMTRTANCTVRHYKTETFLNL